MKVINFGSLNIDYVYRVHDFARPGETIPAVSFSRFAGGKGLNQSIALARAGAQTIHAGVIGKDGIFLIDTLRESGVDCSSVIVDECEPSGHAVIQVADSGENEIVLFPGTNHMITHKAIRQTLSRAEAGDILLLQNEISSIPEIMHEAAERGMRVFFNPAPMTDAVLDYPLELTDTLIVNETEWEALKNHRFSDGINVLRTMGANGAVYNDSIRVAAKRVDKVVDTTAAGDTFIGYFIAELLQEQGIETAMETASLASGWCIQRAGAAASIPWRHELREYQN
ncbi:MAG: ribokinase [Victivallales bacterium]|nr:ribokinase [Victivallales bacterium]